MTEPIILRPDEPIPYSSEPTSITVRLTPKSVADLESASLIVGLNRTDVINRSIQLYRFIQSALSENSRNVLIIKRDGVQYKVVVE